MIHEIVVTMRIESPTKEEAHARVVKWMDDMTASIDKFPRGFKSVDINPYYFGVRNPTK